MLDIFENNNLKITRKLTKRTLKSDKKRNFFVITAIALTAFMIASVFSICFGIIDSLKMQETRLYGSISHAAISFPSEKQIVKIKSLNYVKNVGIGCNVAVVNKPPQTGDISLSMVWLDEIQWNKIHIPAYTDVIGHYPEEANEIMASKWVLEKYGIDYPEIGMTVSLEFKSDITSEFYIEKEFTLCGYFTSYMHIQSESGIILVSEIFANEYGKTVETDGAVNIIFKDNINVNNYMDKLSNDISLTANQTILSSPIFDIDYSKQIPTLAALGILIVFLMFTGYLLIYNVMYISVSRDIRFYGLLKTIGATQKQLRKIVSGQILGLCLIGIPVGLITAALVSLIIVPVIVLGSNIQTGVVVSFSPIIFISATLFSFITALIGAKKPANRAARISPIEATKYTAEDNIKYKIFLSSKGKPYRMALRNIFRNRKRAIVVFLSLFLGLTTFITAITLIASMDTDKYAQSYFEGDFTLKNEIARQGGTTQLFDNSFFDKLEKINGIEDIQIVNQGYCEPTYSEEIFGAYLTTKVEDLAKYGGAALSKEQLIPMFTGKICGLDKNTIIEMNKSLDIPIDVEAFDRGEIGLIGSENADLYINATAKDLEIQCYSSGKTFNVQYAGIMPTYYRYGYDMFAPTIFVSNRLLTQYEDNLIVNTVIINVKDGYAEQVSTAIENLIENNSQIFMDSRFDGIQAMKDAKIILYVLGGGLSLILAIIGIMNFINVMSVNIMIRKRELATMESIGMSNNQIRKMLFCEGMWYGTITLILTSIIGNLLTFGIYFLLQQQISYFILSYPIIPILVVEFLVIIICIVTPEYTYKSINRITISERLRENE